MNKYPIYIVSKGRWESRLTAKALEEMKADYRIVIEPQEYDNYARVIDKNKILVLPFSNLGQGSIPARNWIWEHSEKEGHERHWILDDNIRGFYRLNKNKKTKVKSPVCFRIIEDLVDRYENIYVAGMQYDFFAPVKSKRPPYLLNTRVYSCILLKNFIPYRWRGRYNEDTDLCLRILKDGYCTLLTYFFLCKKARTMTMKGGNTDELYKQIENFDGRLEMAKELRRNHPDCVTIKWKWGRWQHEVDYSKFRHNKLIPKKGIIIPEGINEYDMTLKIENYYAGVV